MTRRTIALATLVCVAVGLLVVLSVPWLLGLHVERLYRAGVRELSRSGYPVAEQEYRRGWFQSDALLLVAAPETARSEPIPKLTPAPNPVQLQVASRILHGPAGQVPWRWPPVLAIARSRAVAVNARRRLPPLLVEAAFVAGGTVVVDWRLPDVAYSGNAGRLHLRDAQGQLRPVDAGHGWSGGGELPLLEAVDVDGRRLVIRGLSWQFHLNSLLAGIPVGSVVLMLDGLQLDAGARQPSLAAAKLSVRLEIGVDAGKAGAELQLSIDELEIDRSAFAPSELRLTLSGLDAPSLKRLLDSLRRLRDRNLPEPARGLAIGTLLTRALPGLASSTPRVRLDDLKLATPNGAVTATGHLGLSADAGTESHAVRLHRLFGEARISVPQALILQALVGQQLRRIEPELRNRGAPLEPLPTRLAQDLEAAAQASLQSLLNDGWLAATSGRLTAAAVLSDGRLTLNGKHVPINNRQP